MASTPASIPAPSDPIFRVSRTFDPFQPPDWIYVRPDGTFGNRFDDPRRGRGYSEWQRFRTIYCSTELAGAYGETAARLRKRPPLIAGLANIDPDLPFDPNEYGGVIDFDWRLKRRVGTMWLRDVLPLVDITAAETLQALRDNARIARTAHEVGFEDIDVSAV